MSDLRVSKWLQNRYPQLTQRQREEAIEEGFVLSKTDNKVKKGDKLGEGKNLNCTKLDLYLNQLKKGGEIEGVKIVEEGDGFVVVDKPAGVASHPISLFDSNTLTQWARFHYPTVSKEFSEAQPTLTPHRLDTGTSGVMIVALNKVVFKTWREKFADKKVIKTYLAWCWGEPLKDSYLAEYSIAHAVGDNRKMVALKGDVKHQPPVLEAHSDIQIVKRIKEKGLCLVKVTCSSGVTHQVRVHLAALGFPLVGDQLYDAEWSNRSLKQPFHLLRAIELVSMEEKYSVPQSEFTELYR